MVAASESTPTNSARVTSASTLITVLKAAGQAGIATCLWSDPGTGKSSLINALAAADGVFCETVIGSMREPSDFAGLPVVANDGMRMEPPAWAKRLHSEGKGIAFLDELSTAAPAVQAAMLGVVLDRQVGELRLPRDVQVIAAANPPDRAADGWDLAPPLANRLLHIDYAPDTDAWIDGMTGGFAIPAAMRIPERNKARAAAARAEVAAFIRTAPQLLHAYPDGAAGGSAASGRAWPSRRTWTMAADLLALLPAEARDVAMVAVSGLVGDGAAIQFLTWRRNADLPNPADVLADPGSVVWTDLDPSRTWAVLAGVVGYCTGRGTQEAWRQAWEPLGAAAENGRADVAAACARTLLGARPANARPPKSARKFVDVLRAAGIMDGEAA